MHGRSTLHMSHPQYTRTHRHPHTTIQTGSRHSSPKKVCNTVNYESSKWFSWWLSLGTASKHRGRSWMLNREEYHECLLLIKAMKSHKPSTSPSGPEPTCCPQKQLICDTKGVYSCERESACCPQNSWLALKRQTEVEHFLFDWSSIQNQLRSHPL